MGKTLDPMPMAVSSVADCVEAIPCGAGGECVGWGAQTRRAGVLWLPLPSHRARQPRAGTRAQRWWGRMTDASHHTAPCPGTPTAASAPWRLSRGPGRGQEACVWGPSHVPVWQPPSTIPMARACLVGSPGHAASDYAKPGYPQCAPRHRVRPGSNRGHRWGHMANAERRGCPAVSAPTTPSPSTLTSGSFKGKRDC